MFSKKCILILISFILVVVSILIILVVFAIGLYKFQWSGPIVQKVVKIIPFPVAINKGQTVSQNHFNKLLEAQRRYYQTQKNLILSDPGKEKELKELKETILDRSIKENFVRQILAKNNIRITPEEIEKEFTNSTTGRTEQEIKDKIQTLYNWTPQDFKQEMIRPYLEKQKLQEIVVFDQVINKVEREKIESILQELKEEADFAELANKYSQDPGNYPDKGGDLGWFGRGQMVKEFEGVAFSLEPGEISDIVTTKFGFHIIKVEEKNENLIRARHILVKARDFNEWLTEQVMKARVWKMNLDNI